MSEKDGRDVLRELALFRNLHEYYGGVEDIGGLDELDDAMAELQAAERLFRSWQNDPSLIDQEIAAVREYLDLVVDEVERRKGAEQEASERAMIIVRSHVEELQRALVQDDRKTLATLLDRKGSTTVRPSRWTVQVDGMAFSLRELWGASDEDE